MSERAERPVVLMTDGSYFSDGILARFFPRLLESTEIRRTDAFEGGDLAKQLPGVDVLVARRVRVTREALARADRLRGIQSWGVGVELIDIVSATACGLPVANSPGNSPTVAEATFTLMLAVTKNLLFWVDAARSGTSVGGSVRGSELRGKALGIVGYGRIGHFVAEIGRGFGMRILVHDPYATAPDAENLPLEDLLAAADIITLHCPLTPKTHHLIDARRLALVKPSAVLINTARGKLIDEPALAAALQEGRLAGAGLDVFEVEPPTADNPLLSLPMVVATPHALPRTWESGARTASMIEDGVLALLAGNLPDYCLNREVGAVRRPVAAA